MKSPDPPKAPDPNQVADAQSAANRETAITQYGLNATNQNTPYGSLSYQQIGTWADGTPRFESTTTLSPEQQQLYQGQTQLGNQMIGIGGQQLGRVSDTLSRPMNLDGAPELRGSYNTDFSADRQRVEDAMMGRLNKQLGQDKASLEQNLANKGISQGSEAYTNAMGDFSQAEQDARTSAILNAGQEQSRLAGLDRDAANFQNAARGQYANEQFALRNQPINEIGALMSGGQVQNPNFVSTPNSTVAPTNVLGAQNMAYQGALDVYNAQQGGSNAMTGGLFNLGGSIAGQMPWGSWFSDRRLKTNITRIGTHKSGLPLYMYSFVWSDKPQVGFMADEVERVMPEAVSEIRGVKIVDYTKVREAA